MTTPAEARWRAYFERLRKLLAQQKQASLF